VQQFKKKKMEQTPKHNTKSMQNANESSIYTLLIAGVVVSLVGVYLRFAFDSTMLSLVSWIILFAGAFICFKAVFKILGS
jgi:F0F1-type ATP synthase assembly protein I